jgi:hypothetical protein
VRSSACGFVSAFASTYLCERRTYKEKYVKEQVMSDMYLKSILMVGSTKLEPQLDKILLETH